MKTVYIETSIVSYLASRPSRDNLIAAFQQATLRWWTEHRRYYELYTSELTIAEARLGDLEASEKRIGYLKGLPELRVTPETRDMAEALVEKGALPRKAEADALHIATATVHHIDLLRTWNCRHIDNPSTKPIVRSVCMSQSYECPEMCTPIELLEVINNEE